MRKDNKQKSCWIFMNTYYSYECLLRLIIQEVLKMSYFKSFKKLKKFAQLPRIFLFFKENFRLFQKDLLKKKLWLRLIGLSSSSSCRRCCCNLNEIHR